AASASAERRRAVRDLHRHRRGIELCRGREGSGDHRFVHEYHRLVDFLQAADQDRQGIAGQEHRLRPPGRGVKIIPVGETPAILPALERGVVDAAMLTTPSRLLARKMGFRELLDFDDLGVQYPYVGLSTLKAHVKKNPDVALRLVRTLTDSIQVFKTNKERSLAVMKRYLRGASDEMLEETYGYFSKRMPRYPYPSVEAVKTALEMMADQFPQANN